MSNPTFDDPKIEAIYQSGLRYIESVRAANRWEDGVLVMPFTCYGCNERRSDYFMTTGDGLPMCRKCFEPPSGSPVPENWNPNGEAKGWRVVSKIDDEALEMLCASLAPWSPTHKMAVELLALRRDFAELLSASREAIDLSDEATHDRYAQRSKAARERLFAILKRHGA